MAQIDRFYIGYGGGNASLQTDIKPFMLPDNAFSQLNNAYIFRDRLRKRFGTQLLRAVTPPTPHSEQLQSRLRVKLGTTNGAGNLSATIPLYLGVPFVDPAIGQMFSVDTTQLLTVNALGTPAALLNTGPGMATYNTTSGALVITGGVINSDVFFYPALPVMGITSFSVNGLAGDEFLYAWDTRFAYIYNYVFGTGWERLGDAAWSGSDTDFFWTCIYRGTLSSNTYLFVTNFNINDLIWYWDTADWAQIAPVIGGGFRFLTSQIIVPFKGRLVAFNTVEQNLGENIGTTDPSTGDFTGNAPSVPYLIDQSFVVGSTVYTIIDLTAGAQAMDVTVIPGFVGVLPTATFNVSTGEIVITGNGSNPEFDVFFTDLYDSAGIADVERFVNRCRYSVNGDPTADNAWIEAPGLGGFTDAPTKESIITAQFLKDRLIVYFTSSAYELVYTNNQVDPFIWQKINTELGAESTFSEVPFDKVILGVSDIGIHACNGSNVERIDNKIPNTVFNINTLSETAPKRIAGIRDYFAESVYWTFPSDKLTQYQTYNDSILVYNYKNNSWAFNDDTITTWGYTFIIPKDDPTQLETRNKKVVAGNQEGYTFLINIDKPTNAQSLQITDINNAGQFTVINHNLRVGDFIKITDINGTLNMILYNNTILRVATVVNANAFTVVTTRTGVYSGGGVIARVSKIEIKTKLFNFYAGQGRNCFVSKVDFQVDATDSGELSVDYFVSSSTLPMVQEGIGTGALLGTSVLETSPYALVPLEETQQWLWHPVYMQADGEYIQFYIYSSDDQMVDIDIVEQDFQMNGIIIFATPTSSRLQ